MAKQIDINVLGQKLRVQGDNAQTIQAYAEFLDNYLRKVAESNPLIDQKTLFLIAGLNLVEEVFILKEDNHRLKTELDKLNSLVQTFQV